MHHTLAWRESIADIVENDITPVVDGIWAIQNGHFLPQSNWNLQYITYQAAGVNQARLRTPTFRQITTPFIRPTIGTIVPGNQPNVADYRSNPLVLRGLEEIEYLAAQTTGGAAVVVGIAGLSQGGLVTPPSGDIYTLSATSTTAAVAGAWTQIAMTFQDTLPQGVFAVVGGVSVSATALAFRLVFEDQVWRPGGLGLGLATSSTHPMFQKGGLGIWGRFNSNRMPNIEVLCNAADAAHQVFLDIVRVA